MLIFQHFSQQTLLFSGVWNFSDE